MVTLSILVGTVLALFLVPWIFVQVRAGSRLSDLPSAYRSFDTAVVLGCPPRTASGAPNPYFARRVDACAALYREGHLTRIILSGAARGLVDEPGAMAAELASRGVPTDVMEQDKDALRTLDSVLRSRDLLGVQRAVVVSQRFHNLRALTLARAAGLDWVGLNARDPESSRWLTKWLRECAARLRMLWDMLQGLS